MAVKTYTVSYTQESDGRWNVEVAGKVNGFVCVTWGRSISEARGHLRDALATALDDEGAAAEARLSEHFHVEGADKLQALRSDREEVDRRTKSLAEETAKAAQRLRGRGLSVRDVAELVGTSHQRVHQLLGSTGKQAPVGATFTRERHAAAASKQAAPLKRATKERAAPLKRTAAKKRA